MKITMQQFKRMIADAISRAGSDDALRRVVEEALEPLKERATDRFGEMRRGIAEEPTPTREERSHMQTNGEKSLMVARMARVLARAKGNVGLATEYAKEWRDEALVKAMTAGSPTAGGFLVPEAFSADVIEHRKTRAVVRSLQARVLPMEAATVRLPKVTSGTTAEYSGETTNITESALGTGQVTLAFKKLTALVSISNDLLRYSSPAADMVVRDDMIRSMASREDRAFLTDDGTSGTPKGLRHWASAGNVVASAGTNTLADITRELGNLVLKLKEAEVPFVAPAWIMSPRTEQRLMTIQDSNGVFVFRPEMVGGRLWGYPFASTTVLGKGAGGHTLLLADMGDVIIGESQRLLLDVSAEAAFVDSGGSLVSAFSRDLSVVRAISEHDLVARHDDGIAVLTGVLWTP